MRKTKSDTEAKKHVPAAGHGRRGEEGHLGYLLRQAAAIHRLRMERTLSDFGVTPPQFSVLTMLAAYPGQSNADIARLALLTPPTVTVIVSNLESMGAVVRRPHAVHGRILHIDITPVGKELLARCRAHVQVLEGALSGDLSAAESDLVRRWLASVAREVNSSEN